MQAIEPIEHTVVFVIGIKFVYGFAKSIPGHMHESKNIHRIKCQSD